MDSTEKVVDGFRFMPPSLRAWISHDIPDRPFGGEIPWTPFKRPIKETTFSLITSAGISMKSDPHGPIPTRTVLMVFSKR